MIHRLVWLRIFSILFAIMACIETTYTMAENLTPPHEPQNDSFYVCYIKWCNAHTIYTPISTYRKRHYIGCMISRKPCGAHLLKQQNCVRIERKICDPRKNGKTLPGEKIVTVQCAHTSLKQFGWFNTYPLALNAFYRCAYSF